MKHWIAAFRLKTLPLALGAIILGSFLNEFAFNATVFVLAICTALLLQILSNLANDYGDFAKGTDKHRKDRQLAGGNITPGAMKWAIIIFVILSLASGILLLNAAFEQEWKHWLIFFGIGLASIAAAIAYTVGDKAYGYLGLGDFFVMVFFGLVGVLGSAYLMKQQIDSAHVAAAIAYGCLAVGVLNVNNIRDLDKDIISNKITLAGKLGHAGALTYQALLLLTAFVGFATHHFLSGYLSLAPIACILLGFIHFRNLQNAEVSDDYNKQLKFLSIGSLVVVLLFILRLHY